MAHDQTTTQDPTTQHRRPEQPEQRLMHPGREREMDPRPDYGEDSYRGSGRLEGRKALITGGDSGIGRAVALAFAREGADVVISHLPEEQSDADETLRVVKDAGGKGVSLPGEDISAEELDHTFRTNILAMFHTCKAALRHMAPGSAIINTGSEQAYQPSPSLLAYASTKAAIVNFSKGLAQQVIERGIRVNVVAPGPVWTPLIPATMPVKQVKSFGQQAPIGRAAQPVEVAPAFVFLASQESSYIAGETIGVTGGTPLP
jgi:NAD(P)-dependent dehydrogenase (short-subunit alcohol dehydrogenase family)